MTGDDSRLFVITSSVARQLKDLSAQILEHSSQVHWSTGANTLSIIAFAKKTVDTTNRELKPCYERLLDLVPFAFPFPRPDLLKFGSKFSREVNELVLADCNYLHLVRMTLASKHTNQSSVDCLNVKQPLNRKEIICKVNRTAWFVV